MDWCESTYFSARHHALRVLRAFYRRVAWACAQPDFPIPQSTEAEAEAAEREASKENHESCGFQSYSQSRSRFSIHLCTVQFLELASTQQPSATTTLTVNTRSPPHPSTCLANLSSAPRPQSCVLASASAFECIQVGAMVLSTHRHGVPCVPAHTV